MNLSKSRNIILFFLPILAVSVLIHEIGHALVLIFFNYQIVSFEYLIFSGRVTFIMPADMPDLHLILVCAAGGIFEFLFMSLMVFKFRRYEFFLYMWSRLIYTYYEVLLGLNSLSLNVLWWFGDVVMYALFLNYVVCVLYAMYFEWRQ